MNTLCDYRERKVDAPIEVLSRSEEWQPLLRFFEGWFRCPASEETGVTSAELDQVERQVGRTMPSAMREWYRLVGAHESQRDETAQDYEMPLERVGISDRGLVLFGENQDGWYSLVLNEDLGLPDPPVYHESFTFDPVADAGYAPESLVDGRLIRVADRLTEFIFAMTLRQAVIRIDRSPFFLPGVAGGSFGKGCDSDRLRLRFSLRKMLDFPAGYDPEFNGSDLIVVEQWGFAARTQSLFEDVEREVISGGGSLTNLW